MKAIKLFCILFTISVCAELNGQITFNACNGLLENQEFIASETGTDGTGRNIFQTTPINGDQPCSGIGVCELKFEWSTANSRWEILADDGSGTFVNVFVLYYNTEPSEPNPPSLMLGTWVENTAVTATLCGGDLTVGNATLTGDVQDTTLSTAEEVISEGLFFYPNPASDFLILESHNTLVDKVTFYDIQGRFMSEIMGEFDHIDVSEMADGIYFAQIEFDAKKIIRKIIIK